MMRKPKCLRQKKLTKSYNYIPHTMNSNKSFQSLILLFILIGSTATAQNSQNSKLKAINVLPDNPALQYSGRIDYTNPKQPIFYWAGTAIKTNFSGTSLGVCFFDPKGDNYYNVFIDGTPLSL